MDDDPSSAEALTELLRQEGHDATHPNTVAEAIAALSREPYRLLIVDPSLREGGGRRFLDLAGTLGVPTVVITSDPAFDPERTRYTGLAGFLYKPIHWPTLLGLVAGVFDPDRPA